MLTKFACQGPLLGGERLRGELLRGFFQLSQSTFALRKALGESGVAGYGVDVGRAQVGPLSVHLVDKPPYRVRCSSGNDDAL